MEIGKAQMIKGDTVIRETGTKKDEIGKREIKKTTDITMIKKRTVSYTLGVEFTCAIPTTAME